mmetsp:Transcript_26359/g.39840  ORF Transcript_26359/g.39840 Transcript_26359/m.39840 type:complete len:302 (-) Transcript_26359:1596-2501(-)
MTMPMPFHHQQQPHLSRYQYQPMKVFGLGPVFSARRVTSINPAVSERKIRAEPMPRALMLTPVKSAKEQLTLNATKAQELCAQPVKSAFKRVRFAKKRVTLNPTVSVHEICAKPITKEEKSELYYTKDDYDMTILEVKAIALTHQLPQASEEDTSERSNCMVAAEADGFLRGIELLIYPQRFQNKLVARRALIKYQTHLETNCNGVTPEQKAKAMRMAGEKLSAWSHKVARETARLDSIRAYDAEYLIPLDDQQVEFTPFPELTFKRKASFQEEVRRVTPEPEDPPRPLFKKARAAIRAAA